MSLAAGRYALGPENGSISVRTGRTGAAAKAGHDLLIDVTVWQATLELGEGSAPSSIVLDADATSLVVREGTGGMQALGDDDKASIRETIDDEVLLRRPIGFRSTAVRGDAASLSVDGALTLVGAVAPISFVLTIGDDGTLSADAVVTQSLWGMKPYSTLFGTLKVVDDVRVTLEGRLPG